MEIELHQILMYAEVKTEFFRNECLNALSLSSVYTYDYHEDVHTDESTTNKQKEYVCGESSDRKKCASYTTDKNVIEAILGMIRKAKYDK